MCKYACENGYFVSLSQNWLLELRIKVREAIEATLNLGGLSARSSSLNTKFANKFAYVKKLLYFCSKLRDYGKAGNWDRRDGVGHSF